MFDKTGQTSLNVLLGDKAIEYPQTGKPVTYTYKGEDLVSEAESRVYGHITLITLNSDTSPQTTQSSIIVDWREEMVYFLDNSGNYRTCPATVANQGGLVGISWDCEESETLDPTGENDKGIMLGNLLNWGMVDNAPDDESRFRIIVNNLSKLV